MDLPNLFSASESKPPFVIALLITDISVQASLWKVDAGRILLVETSDVHDYRDEKACLVETDKALQELGPDSEHITEVVFGFEPWWVSDAGIKDEKKPLLKKLTQELSLKAVGFVVVTEAIAQHLRAEDPLVSALTIYFSDSHLALTLLRQGKVVKTEVVGRSGDSVADVVEGLARFPVKKQNAHFPAKMILASHTSSRDELETEQQALLDHPWTDESTFLHPPVIELIPENALIKIITEQGGRAVAEAQGLLSPVAQTTATDETSDKTPGVLASEALLEASERSESDLAESTEESAGFGFTAVDDEPESLSSEDSDTQTLTRDAETGNDDDNLTAVDDIEAELNKPKSFGVPISPDRLKMETAVDTDTAVKDSVELPSSTSTQPSLKSDGFWVWLTADRGYTRADMKRFALMGFGAGILALLIVGYFGLTAAATALVDISLAAKPVSKQVTIVLDPRATSSDPNTLQLAAQTVTKDLTVSGSVSVTGTKAVGERAKGRVTVFNKTTSAKSFAAGTTLTANGQRFTLDEAITVASASVSQAASGEGETKTYGKVETAATAVNIGTDGNIAQGAKLIIDSFDEGTYSAEAASAFTGGSSKDVTVVADKDRQAALTKVQTEARRLAEDEFKKESGNGTYLISTGNLRTLTSTYSAQVGAEATELSLELKVQAEALSYRSDDLLPLAAAALSDQVPAGYTLSSDRPQVLSQPVENATGSAATSIAANISSQALPQLNPDQIKDSLKGLPIAQAQSQLVGQSEIETASVEITPSLSRFIVRSMPTDSTRIRVRITP